MEFEWDEVKAETNLQKHGVSFAEAATTFGDPLAVTFLDLKHSDDEDRFLTIGQSSDGRALILCHTDRDAKTRIISARLASRAERKGYEDGNYPSNR